MKIDCCCLLLLVSLGTHAFADEVKQRNEKPNVLFIAIDDMNDWTGFLGGHPQAVTPNMDRLAKRGVSFTNAHCIAPACSPCRLGLLYGVQPFHSGLYPFYDHGKIPAKVLEQYTSLPRCFRKSGYQTFGAGKIFHGSKANPEDWDDYLKKSNANLKYDAQRGYQQGDSQKMAFCPTTNSLEDHPDHQVASYGIDVLNQKHDKPFFLGVGIVKPHLAFVCPQQFFDMQATDIKPSLVRRNDLADVPWVGRSMANLSDDYQFRTDDAWEKVHRSYLACITWADFNIGRVLDALENSPHADNTVVVLWSDHGYHQGEKRSFRKFSLWEESTRVPFLIYDPRQNDVGQGRMCDEAVSLIDIYRTLGDLCDIDVQQYVDGESLVPQLVDPKRPIARPAITTWGRGNYAVRDDHHRYIRYFDGSEELYDHAKDPQEWNNLAGVAEYDEVQKRLASHLPKNEASLVKQGVALWNVIDADRPGRLEKFKQTDWPKWKETLRPRIE
ncbi:MAG: sulfatase [Pirellulaceae bacterium]